MELPQSGVELKLDEHSINGEDTEQLHNANLLQKIQELRDRIQKQEGTDAAVQKFLPLLQSLKAVERNESVWRSNYEALESNVNQLEDKLAEARDDQTLSEDLNDALAAATDDLDSTKKDFAGRLRVIVSVKKRIDDVPTPSELIQYERRFSELNTHIQEKHRQTRKYYATYNALQEMKELMLKETSLLNSISSQFQNAIASTDGHMKLIDSMDAIIKGSKQKLQKVQIALEDEQKGCDALKKRYAAAMADQRRCYSLLKAFQEECARNERLEKEISNQSKATA
ncbi:hypothetical protein M5689_011382 [Euphorbia peplus]|nr:hypothetical protein M5689_011382 [Euphorbia peplus]